ncbi:response regulator transcription factor, partial [Paenibacillus polymyxa]
MNKRVLLVEDEIRIREVIADYFKQNKWEVYEAGTGKDALIWFDSVQPDLIVLDIMM